MAQHPQVKALLGWGIALLVIGSLVTAGFALGGRAFHNWLDEMEPDIVSPGPAAVDPANDGKLVHVVGAVTPYNERLVDPECGVSAKGFALARVYEEYRYLSGDGGGYSRWCRCNMGVPDGTEPTTLWR